MTENITAKLLRERDAALAEADRMRTNLEAVQLELQAALGREERLRGAISEMVYEATHLWPCEDNGSHWCNIKKETLSAARSAIQKGE